MRLPNLFDRVIPRRGTASEKWDIPRGEDVLPLWVADMDFRAAPAIVDALRSRVEDGVFGYALPPRTWHDSLRRWLHRRHGWKVETHSILDATGIIPALAAAIRAFCVPGDKVIVQTPVYNCFFRTIRNQGCKVRSMASHTAAHSFALILPARASRSWTP